MASKFSEIQATNQYYEEEKDRRRRQAVSGLFTAGATIAGGIYGFKKLSAQFKYSSDDLPFLKYNFARLEQSLDNYSPEFNLGDKIINTLRGVEDLSPAQLFRTFNLSTALSPFLISKKYNFNFERDSILENQKYWEGMINARGNVKFEDLDLKYGLRFEDNALYEMTDAKGTKGRKILNSAVLEFTQFKTPKMLKTLNEHGGERPDDWVYSTFKNKPLRKIMDIWGISQDVDVSRVPMLPRGGRNKAEVISDSVRAYGRLSFERGAKVFDKPIEALLELFPSIENFNVDEGTKKVFGRVGEYLKPFLEPGFGTGGDYTQSIPKSLLKMTKNIAYKGGLLALGLTAADYFARQTSPEGGLFEEGLASGGAKLYAGARITYAKAVSDNFEGWKQKQEEIAPESTKLTTLAGAPLSLALGGAMASYFKYLGDAYQHGVPTANEAKFTPTTVPFLKRSMSRTGKWAAIGALVGGAIVAPFVPGALVTGDSSEELRKEYFEGKEIAVRANRYWETGGYDWEGGKIKYFAPSFIYRTIKNYKQEARGGEEIVDKTNPWLHPFDYLRDPYALEKATDESRPYPIWGMDVSEFSFIGKFFERTLGQIIKPDVVNPRLLAEGTKQEGDVFTYGYKADSREAALVQEGKQLPNQAARFDPNAEAVIWSFGAAKDFIGLKGFMVDNLEKMLGINSDEIEQMQLARSGEMSNASRDIKELNAGGMMLAGEGIRRIIPTNAGSIINRFNNMQNNMASWLPKGEESNFYIDYSKGDPYRKIELGEARLPGAGFAKLNPEVEGLNPEDYPDIYKYKILADVGLGSKEYYGFKNRFDSLASAGILQGRELELYNTIKEQERQRSEGKRFSEYQTEEEMQGRSLMSKFLTRYWETVSHVDPIHEKLMPVRPGSKFLSQRSALEDYEKTQIYTGDTAMWTKPVEHYGIPFMTQLFRTLGSDYVPQDTEERYNIEDYFDKLEYLKYRRLHSEAVDSGDSKLADTYQRKYEQTLQGAVTTGLDEQSEILNAFIALPKREREYFGAFYAADEETREKIKETIPTRISALYEQVWARKDILEDNTTEDGVVDFNAAQEQIQAQIRQEDEQLREAYPQLSQQYENSEKRSSFREFLADAEAAAYIEGTTGIPDSDFVGWDPRIDLDAVKLRTLNLGKEDIYEYGFFKSDQQNLEKLVAVLQDQQVTTKSKAIKENIKRQKLREEDIRAILEKEGIQVTELTSTNSVYDSGSMTLNLEEENV